jgi:hypothetical protein
MTIAFHQGNHPLYRRYAARPWNDEGLLMLDSHRSDYDRWLMEQCNTEEGMTALLAGDGPKNCRPFGVGSSKLSEYIGADQTGIIVVKGLHQWQRMGRSWNYRLHITLGLEGQLWHLYALYHANGRIAFTSECSAGERVTGEDHEGFERVGRKKKR